MQIEKYKGTPPPSKIIVEKDPLLTLQPEKTYLKREHVWCIEMREGMAFVRAGEETFKVKPENLVFFE
jgi:hypothetical protein